MTTDPILDDLFHGVIWSAFIAEARKAGTWPEAERVKQAAYRLFETERRREDATLPAPASPSPPPAAKNAVDHEAVLPQGILNSRPGCLRPIDTHHEQRKDKDVWQKA